MCCTFYGTTSMFDVTLSNTLLSSLIVYVLPPVNLSFPSDSFTHNLYVLLYLFTATHHLCLWYDLGVWHIILQWETRFWVGLLFHVTFCKCIQYVKPSAPMSEDTIRFMNDYFTSSIFHIIIWPYDFLTFNSLQFGVDCTVLMLYNYSTMCCCKVW